MAIRNSFIQDWSQQVNDTRNNPIMRTYKLIKFNFGIESYLTKVSIFKYRKSITKLRTSSHDLHIEKGRHSENRLPVEQRLCKMCNVIEDEAHFLLSCRLFSNERLTLYEKLNLNGSDISLDTADLLFYLLGSTNQRHPDLQLLSPLVYHTRLKIYQMRGNFITVYSFA